MSSPHSSALILKGKEPALVPSSRTVTPPIPLNNEGNWKGNCEMKDVQVICSNKKEYKVRQEIAEIYWVNKKCDEEYIALIETLNDKGLEFKQELINNKNQVVVLLQQMEHSSDQE